MFDTVAHLHAGAATIVWASVAGFILLDFPATSKRLTDREREIAIKRLREGGVTVRSEDGPKYSKAKSLLFALKQWQTWGFVLGYMGKIGVLMEESRDTDLVGCISHCRFFNTQLFLSHTGPRIGVQVHSAISIHDSE